MRVLLVATYELGRQPFGLASPAAWLEREGCRVQCVDLSLERFDTTPGSPFADADLVAFHLPMHTATRLAAEAARRVRELNPTAHLCFYGLYASLNESFLRELGGQTILGGEFEAALVQLVRRLHEDGPPPAVAEVSLERQQFLVPQRAGLPPLARYAGLMPAEGARRTVGYTEATRGCKHLCRHCPIVPVYGGRLFVVQAEVVLEDVRQQVAAGARHITFGDPDFFNGPGHVLPIVASLHREFPELTYDVTIKVEHLLRHRRHLAALAETGCLLVTTAVESVDDRVLQLLDKGHTREEFVEATQLARRAGLHLNPTFIPFTPWITPASYLELLRTVAELELVDHVAPVQYGIRLLVTESSRLLELPELRELIGPFDPTRLAYDWQHAEPRVDALQRAVFATVHESQHAELERRAIFARIWQLARDACGDSVAEKLARDPILRPAPPVRVPYLTEPWYC